MDLPHSERGQFGELVPPLPPNRLQSNASPEHGAAADVSRSQLLHADSIREWFNNELDRLEKRKERGIFSVAQERRMHPNIAPAPWDPARWDACGRF